MATRLTYNFDTWDASTVTASETASTDLAAANLVQDHVGKVWRSTSTNPNIVFNQGSAVAITVFAIFNFNFTSAATVTLQGNASDSWGSPSYSQALTIPTDADSSVLKRIVFYLSQTYQYWRLVVDDSENPDEYIDIGRILAGSYYEPSRSMSEGFTVQLLDPSEGTNKAGTHTFWRQRNKYRKVTTGFSMIDRTQYEKFLAVFEKIGNSRPVILSLDPTDNPSKDSLYAYLITPLSLTNRLLEQYNVIRLVWEEKTQ